MSKTPPPTKEERLAKALRENLARRKALVRAKRARTDADAPPDALSQADEPSQDEAQS